MFVEQPSSGLASAVRSGSRAEGVDPLETMSIGEVERRICELAAHINAATCSWLMLVAEFERRRGHESFGFASCASWLAWRCSIELRAAYEQLRVARALGELPRIAFAFRRGALSYSKVRALTRVAEPHMEETLLMLAEDATAAQLERALRGYRAAIEPGAAANAASGRHVTTQWEDDGTLSIRANLPAEEGALVLKALDAARDALREDARARGDETERGAGASQPRPDRADALVAVAETAIAGGIASRNGGERQQLVVHVDVDALSGSTALGPASPTSGRDAPSGSRPAFTAAPASIEGAGNLSAETARRLGCDASIVTLVEREGKPLSVGRKTRSVPPALRRALAARDNGCRFPGCERQRFVDAHHIEHWARGGETSLENLVQLCGHHHRLVHEGGFSIAREAGGMVFRDPAGRSIERSPALPEGSIGGCVRESRRSGSAVDARTCAPRGAGEHMDLDLTVFVLAQQEERRRAAMACESS